MRIVLHIGTPKTGTTVLQHSFYANRKTLANHGVLYPASCVEKQHAFLAFIAGYDLKFFDELTAWNDEAHVNLKRCFEREIAETNCHTVILSSEILFHLTFLQRKKLRQYLNSFSKNLKIIAYIRHPIAFMLSEMGQHLKMGYNFDFDYFSEKHYLSTIPDAHWKILQNFQKDFGIDALQTFAYQKDFIEDWDVTEHFCEQVFGLSELETWSSIDRMNENLDSHAAQLISEMHYLKPRLNQFTNEWQETNHYDLIRFVNHLPQMKNKLCVPLGLVRKIEKKSSHILEIYKEQFDIKFSDFHYDKKQFNQHKFTKEYIWEMFKKLDSRQVTKNKSEDQSQQSDVFLSNEVTKNLALFFFNSIEEQSGNFTNSDTPEDVKGVLERNTVFFRKIIHHISGERNVRPIIYGIGRVCDLVLPYLSEHGIDVSMFLDQKAEANFIEKNGSQVHPLSSLKKNQDYHVIVCSYNKFLDMKRELFDYASKNNITVTLYTVAGIFRNF